MTIMVIFAQNVNLQKYWRLRVEVFDARNFANSADRSYWNLPESGCRHKMTIRCGATEEIFESDQYHIHFRLNGKLIGIGIDTVTSVGIYSRAFYYDLNYKHLSIGNYSSLIECFLVRKLLTRDMISIRDILFFQKPTPFSENFVANF